MIASRDFTSSGLGVGTFAATSAGVIIGVDGGIFICFTGSDFCAPAAIAAATTAARAKTNLPGNLFILVS
jgi:hypothetical protein